MNKVNRRHVFEPKLSTCSPVVAIVSVVTPTAWPLVAAEAVVTPLDDPVVKVPLVNETPEVIETSKH